MYIYICTYICIHAYIYIYTLISIYNDISIYISVSRFIRPRFPFPSKCLASTPGFEGWEALGSNGGWINVWSHIFKKKLGRKGKLWYIVCTYTCIYIYIMIVHYRIYDNLGYTGMKLSILNGDVSWDILWAPIFRKSTWDEKRVTHFIVTSLEWLMANHPLNPRQVITLLRSWLKA